MTGTCVACDENVRVTARDRKIIQNILLTEQARVAKMLEDYTPTPSENLFVGTDDDVLFDFSGIFNARKEEANLNELFLDYNQAVQENLAAVLHREMCCRYGVKIDHASYWKLKEEVVPQPQCGMK